MKKLFYIILALCALESSKLCGDGWTIFNNTDQIVEIKDWEHWCNQWASVFGVACLDYRNNHYIREILPGKTLTIQKLGTWRDVELSDPLNFVFIGSKNERFERFHVPAGQNWKITIEKRNLASYK